MVDETTKRRIFIGIGVAGILLLLIFILVAVSFGNLDYYEYGFKKQKSTSRVFTDRVYKGGRYLIGPDFDFKVYPASANSITLTKTIVFSKDTLEVTIDVEFQYFLRPQQLHILHKKYQLTFNAVIRSSAMDALKAVSAQFTTEQFIKDRINVEKAMELTVKKRIGGKCCEADCTLDVCLPGCIPLNYCTKESDFGMMVTLRYFSLKSIKMPYKVYQRYLKALLLVEDSQKEKYLLEEAVVKKEVDESVKAVGNQANEYAQNSTAEAKLITQKANAEALKVVGAARSEGLNNMMMMSNITDSGQKMSFHYLLSLSSNSKVHMAVDFSNYVIGGGK